MIHIACACNKNRATASGAPAVTGTYRIMVNGKKVYESANKDAAESVALRFDNATVLAPGENA